MFAARTARGPNGVSIYKRDCDAGRQDRRGTAGSGSGNPLRGLAHRRNGVVTRLFGAHNESAPLSENPRSISDATLAGTPVFSPICLSRCLALPFLCMTVPTLLPCDGCGQLASAEHIARRLQRLEWATRFRPTHIQALLLAASAPDADSEFLYSPEAPFTGLAGDLLSALSISTAGKSNDEVLADFQKRGLFLVNLLECPFAPGIEATEAVD